MTDVEQEQIVVRFGNLLRSVPHRSYCPRTNGTSHRCSCDIGQAAMKVFNEFQSLIVLAKGSGS